MLVRNRIQTVIRSASSSTGDGSRQSRAVLSLAPGHDGLAVGAEGHGHDRVLVLHGRPMGLPVAASQSRAVLSVAPGERRSCRRG